MSRELSKAYDPKEGERKQYEFWRERGYFAAPVKPDAPAFSLTIPPPNVTGELHMGHALQHAIHDLIVRRKRMQGFNVLCLPGTDHAGISTNIKVAQALRAEGKDRWEVGREGFIARAREWTLKYGGTILGQLEALGCSYDWSRTRFTLDEFVEEGPQTASWALGTLYTESGYARAVLTAFVRFFERGWIYRGERIVNWCPQCQTTLSELEMEYRDVASHLWHLRYPAKDGGEGLVVATTRPETMLGDTGVAVSPSDERYRDLIGKALVLPLMEREIPVVADRHVSAEFGTGAVKVTPAHDPNDWEIAQRHPELLPALRIMDDQGRMTAEAGAYAGLTREAARKKVLADLEARGLLVKVEDYTHSVGHHDKCGTVIEPLLKLQWWARCGEPAAMTLAAIRSGRVTFTPERFTQQETDWLENIRDWCVSRQLWWGHRIPLHYCLQCDPGVTRVETASGPALRVAENAQPIAAVEPPERCPRCGSTDLEQDPDVLDTWFSSALWPFATLGWPKETPELAYFYPTDLMITGRDILYLWVARMIMTGEEFMGREPFREVLVHATVMNEDGKRMSKSLGTGVDPLDLIALYGADATRFGLTSLVTESQDIRFKMQWKSGGKTAAGPEDTLARAEQIEQMRNFCNKLWNISRFVLMSLGEEPVGSGQWSVVSGQSAGEGSGFGVQGSAGAEEQGENPAASIPHSAIRNPQSELADRWILSRFAAASAAVNDALDRYDLGEASWALYHFVWDELADWYLELAKPRLRSEDPQPVREVLLAVLEGTLRLAHPFLPFITEEIWQSLPSTPEDGALIVAAYPGPHPELRDQDAEARMDAVMEVTRAIRNLKAELGVPQQTVEAAVLGDGELELSYVAQSARVRITRERPEGPTAHTLAAGVEIVIAVGAGVDKEAEGAKIRKELEAIEKDLRGVEGKLGNPQFVARAPAEVVEKQRRQREELLERRSKLEERLRLFED
jgi:valyl-tRNA synthetase